MDNDVADVVVVGFVLERQGEPFDAAPCPGKTSDVNNEFYLYCSGGEASGRFRDVAHLDHVSAWRFITPSSAILGGLVVADTTVARRPYGTAVAGRYAVGRSAVGICSRSYGTGLSLAGCVFSGRRAGKYNAAAGISRRRR